MAGAGATFAWLWLEDGCELTWVHGKLAIYCAWEKNGRNMEGTDLGVLELRGRANGLGCMEGR